MRVISHGGLMQARRSACSSPEQTTHDPSTLQPRIEAQSRRRFLQVSSSALLGGLLTGCHQLNMKKWFEKEEDLHKNVRSALKGEDGHSRLIGHYIKIADSTLGYIKVQGVGFVHGLEGTGEDPPASPLRKQLLDDMRHRGIHDPNTLLHSADTCLVVVTAYVPPIVKKGETLDIEISLPDGSETRSLAGGWLMPCFLSEHAMLGGAVRSGVDLVISTGAILVDGLAELGNASTASLRKGVIPGGGKYTGDDRTLIVGIRTDYQTVRMSSTIANRIGKRFFDYDSGGLQRPLCKAKSNSHLELVVKDRYRDNYPRFLQCIRHMALSESPVERHMRMQQLEQEIKIGVTAEKAALQLEAIGTEGIPILRKGLKSDSPEARFRSAEALAYLGQGDGAKILGESAANEPAFRIFALAALAAMSGNDSAEALRELMNVQSLETRYGAFRALSTMAPDDPYIRGVRMEGDYHLHLVDSRSSPFIHITRRKKPEIVLFDPDQTFMLPMFVRAGARIVIQGSPAGDSIVLKRVAVGEETQTKTVSPRVADVIKAASDLGATYPDIVQMLVQAQKQHNLQGEIAIDRLPKPGRVYQRKPADLGAESAAAATPAQIGNDGLMPNMFDEQPSKPLTSSRPPLPDPEAGVPSETGTLPEGANTFILE